MSFPSSSARRISSPRAVSGICPIPVSSEKEVRQAALNLFDDIYHNEPIRLIGVGLEKVTDRDKTQGNLAPGARRTCPVLNQQLTLGGKIFLRQGPEGEEKA
jgi:hypothetical protein